MKFSVFLQVLCFVLMIVTSAKADKILKVKNGDELILAISKAKPGTTIKMAKGIWKNIEIDFYGNGTPTKPITLEAEKSGQVFIEGESNLKMSGTYLTVKGLIFRNGYTPSSDVIAFQKSKGNVCNNCRVTECVIDNFNNPERFEQDIWVSLFGKNNRFDHNHLTGKRNQGVTVAIRLEGEESRGNHHQIDHNYFGPRPSLGSNGGETIRIGTSHNCTSNSNTVVSDNFFDRCSGEVEIISNKSCQNIFRNNTFFECQGTITLRHGNETLVENNYFFGNRKPHTGGIRVINENQKVINNYCEGLTGYRFRSAFAIMNGVPNSPANRYLPVINAYVANNSFINCDNIQICTGSDKERSVPPKSSVISNNIFYNTQKQDVFKIFDDISGIRFDSNVVSSNIDLFKAQGFMKKDNILSLSNGLMLAPKDMKVGFVPNKMYIRPTRENTGITWYPKFGDDVAFYSGKTITLNAATRDLYQAVKSASPGDRILLPKGKYTVEKSININFPLTIEGMGNASDVTIYFEKSTLFNIENVGSLQLKNLNISGAEAPDKPGNAVIRTSKYPMTHNYKLFMENCDFRDMTVNHSFNVFSVYKHTFADSIYAKNCTFKNVSGSVFTFDKESEDLGIYNVENMYIDQCQFENIDGAAIDLYRGGTDESTLGPRLNVVSSKFKNVGFGQRNVKKASIMIHGVQYAFFNQNAFEKSKAINMFLIVGDPIIKFSENKFIDSEKIISNSDKYEFKE